MQRRTIIKRIRKIIGEFGGFSCVDVDSSPIVSSFGKNTFQLAEQFYFFKITTTTYVDEMETGEDYILYEDLSKGLLEEILILAEQFEAQEIQTAKRISN